jgi:hypothetical protein
MSYSWLNLRDETRTECSMLEFALARQLQARSSTCVNREGVYICQARRLGCMTRKDKILESRLLTPAPTMYCSTGDLYFFLQRSRSPGVT